MDETPRFIASNIPIRYQNDIQESIQAGTAKASEQR